MEGHINYYPMTLVALQRMAELRREADQNRLARMARKPQMQTQPAGPFRRLVGRLAPAT